MRRITVYLDIKLCREPRDQPQTAEAQMIRSQTSFICWSKHTYETEN